MATDDASLAAPGVWADLDADARRLTDALRGGRLTVLVGAPRSGKSTLLVTGVLPLLHRRAADRPRRSGMSAGTAPSPDRRSREQAELLVHVDQWGTAALSSVDRPLDAALGDPDHEAGPAEAAWPMRLASAARRHGGLRILFVLDHFEQVLAAAGAEGEARRLIEACVQAIDAPGLDVHFLVALDERAWPRWQTWGQRVPCFGERAFALQAPAGRTTLVPLHGEGLGVPGGAPRPAPRAPDFEASLATMLSEVARTARPADPLSDEQAASIDAMLSKVAEAARHATPSPSRRASAPASPFDSGTAVPGPARRRARPARPLRRWEAAALAVLVFGAALWAVRRAQPVGPPPALSEATTRGVLAPAPAAPATSDSAPFEIQLDAPDGSANRLTLELARALSRDAPPLRVVASAEGADTRARLGAPRRMSIALDDTLRAARADASSPPLRVLAPLFAQEVFFIVRADSPLQFIHDLRGRRVDIGPAHLEASHTVRAIYRQMFGEEPISPTQFGKDAALAELVGFRSIDAMAIVDGQPSAWLASIDARTASGLRLLKLDAGHAADRLALQRFRAAVLQPGPGVRQRTATLAVMSYLVVSGEGETDARMLTEMTRALCRELPRLRAGGHPKWRELKPSMQLDTGWPVLESARAGLTDCTR